ncbi:MAG: vitamin K epoxide reductase family protein [Armatimonadota bacterium]
MAKGKEWPIVTGLAISGILDSLYLLLFQTKKIEHLVCPVFDGGCEQVAASDAAFPGGVPDAIYGVAGYSAAAGTAIAIPRTSGRVQKWLAGAMIGGSLLAVGLSAYLTYAQPKKTGAWCFWCLTSAVVSSLMAPIAISGASRVLRESRQQHL